MRGPVQCMASILAALQQGPLYSSQLRRATRLKGSTITKHIDRLLQQQLITTWTEPYNPAVDYRYYRLTEKGRRAAGYIQLTFDILGIPEEDHR